MNILTADISRFYIEIEIWQMLTNLLHGGKCWRVNHHAELNLGFDNFGLRLAFLKYI